MNYRKYSSDYYADIRTGLSSLIATDGQGRMLDPDTALEQWADLCEEKRKQRGVFFFCGNGASATMAEHMSHDCFQNADFLTQTCSETSHITAISNDISYEDVFAYRIGKMLGEKDMLITVSSSGNSPNIVKALQKARELGVFAVTLSGKRAGGSEFLCAAGNLRHGGVRPRRTAPLLAGSVSGQV